MKKIIAFFVTVVLVLSCFVFTASAVGATISFSSNKPEVGNSVTVNVRITTNDNMTAESFTVSYNPNILKFVSGTDATGGAGSVDVVSSQSGTKSKTFTLNFTALATGSSNIQVSNCIYVSETGNEEVPLSGAAASLTVVDKAKSSNANLKSLSVSKGTLSPRFSASRTSYTVSVAEDVTECAVYATAADEASGAKVAISGNNKLEMGKNTRTVTVTAASGAQKTYTIVITRSKQEENTSKPEEPTETEPDVDPYEVTVEGNVFTAAKDISAIKLPKGFEATVAEHNGVQVAVAEDKESNFRIYYLKQNGTEEYIPYLFDEENEGFTKLEYVTIGENTYIFADMPSGYTFPEDFRETSLEIGGLTVPAFSSSNHKLSDFYYVYCFYDNAYRIYRYDEREKVLQRCPEIELVNETKKVNLEEMSVLDRFKTLTTNAKIIVLGGVFAALIMIAIVTLAIIKTVQRKRYMPDFNQDELPFNTEFDDIIIDDGEDIDINSNIVKK